MPDLKSTIAQLSRKGDVEREENHKISGQMQSLGVDRRECSSLWAWIELSQPLQIHLYQQVLAVQ